MERVVTGRNAGLTSRTESSSSEWRKMTSSSWGLRVWHVSTLVTASTSCASLLLGNLGNRPDRVLDFFWVLFGDGEGGRNSSSESSKVMIST